MNKNYKVEKYTGNKDIIVNVPGSKSITNRALLLAALSAKRCLLKGVLFSDDTLAMLECLKDLGIDCDINEVNFEVIVTGCGGVIPKRNAKINVRSAGTTARFLTVVLGFCGGEYIIDASKQMKKRPMRLIIELLRSLGVKIECLQEEGFFPLKMSSALGSNDYQEYPLVSVDTNISSQFASALLITGAVSKQGLRVKLKGERSKGAYIAITLKMMTEFGIDFKKEDRIYSIKHNYQFGLDEYKIEPDLSSACYFYGMAPLLKVNVLVRDVYKDSIQGDIRFIHLLEEMGCSLKETRDGIRLDGRGIDGYDGIDVDMQDFSDQVMTLAVIAPFAKSETMIRNVAHIRHQESDRLLATKTELKRIGIECDLIEDGTGLLIKPFNEILTDDFVIHTYEDHRIAMAFTLIGLKTGRIVIKDPGCCAKTFVNYFDIIDDIIN